METAGGTPELANGTGIHDAGEIREVRCAPAEIAETWLAAGFIAFSYVLSLYIHPGGPKLFSFPIRNRDDPVEIKSRFHRVLCASVLSFIISVAFQHVHGVCGPDKELPCLLRNMGVRVEGTLAAVVIPALLTVIFFLGPIVGDAISGRWNGYNRVFLKLMYYNLHCRRRVFRDTIFCWMWWRAYVVAPLSEEFVYRACLIPVIAVCYGRTVAAVVSPLSFGVAHLHHIFDRIRLGSDPLGAVVATSFQIAYTSIFGLYSAFLFVRTGNIAAPIFVHALCNVLGVPDIGVISRVSPKEKLAIVISYLAGFFLWLYLVDMLTKPDLYASLLH